jgi:serine/threonine protein kinase
MASEAVRAGGKLGPYELLTPIGEGGMGEVWKANDPRLGRTVALKLSKADFTERFEREARAVAALSHPNICTLFDVGPNYLVMEYIEGAPLQGPMPVPKALEYAGQILDALDAAHRKGIVHRDLKPANILVTKHGIKLLDFGLAKQAGLGVTDATMTAALTGAGQILGTLQYMSPEQLQGQEADARSDIFAFGCVLYEMLTGKRAFEGASAASVIASILEREPAPLSINAPLDRVVRTCLSKDPDRRFQNALDLRRAIEWANAEQPVVAPPRTLVWPIVALAAVVVLGMAAWLWKPAALMQRVNKFDLSIPGLSVGGGFRASISPDGTKLLYSVNEVLQIRDLNQFEGRALSGTERATNVFWSPDSQWIGFFQNQRLMKIAVSGGEPLRVANLSFGLGNGSGAAWGADDRIVFSPAVLGHGIYETSARGGDLKPYIPLIPGERDLHEPSFLPDGKGVLFLVDAHNQHISKLCVYANGTRKELLDLKGDFLRSPTYSPSGHIVFARSGGTGFGRAVGSGGVWAVPFSMGDLKITGEPFLVAESAMWPTTASDGSLSIMRGISFSAVRAVWLTTAGNKLGDAGEKHDGIDGPELSRDGTRLLYRANTVSEAEGWVQDLRTGHRVRLTNSPDVEGRFRWAPSEDRVYFSYRPQSGNGNRLASVPADGRGVREELGPGVLADVSPDGRTLLYEAERSGATDLFYRASAAGDAGKPVWPDAGTRTGGRFSPDGRFVAYLSLQNASPEVSLSEFGAQAGKWQISSGGGLQVRWNRSGTKLYYLGLRNDMWEVDITTRPSVKIGKPRQVFVGSSIGVRLAFGFDVSPSGDKLLALAGPTEKPPTIGIIQNWAAEFAKR